MRPALAPLVLAWLALHAVLLGLILGVKFVGFKLAALTLLLLSVVWFLRRPPRRLALAPINPRSARGR